MKRSLRFPVMVVALAALAPQASARLAMPGSAEHFRLLQPASWIVENERGDPQKAGPCGGSNASWGTPSFAVTEVVGGSMLPIQVQETIYHPGHYRIALAVNSMLELPPDPETVERDGERGPLSVSATIQNPAEPPVLMDGLWEHYERPPEGQMNTWETEVQIPNINCENCTLQVVQWMAEHGFNNPGGYTYHHCATLEITANPNLPIDTRWPAERAD